MYPSLRKNIVMEAVKFVLDTESMGTMSEERKITILEAVELYLNNSYLFYTSIEINGICHYWEFQLVERNLPL